MDVGTIGKGRGSGHVSIAEMNVTADLNGVGVRQVSATEINVDTEGNNRGAGLVQPPRQWWLTAYGLNAPRGRLGQADTLSRH